MKRSEIDAATPEQLVVMTVQDLRRVRQVCDQLYREGRLNGDTQRDMAQSLDCTLDGSEVFGIDELEAHAARWLPGHRMQSP